MLDRNRDRAKQKSRFAGIRSHERALSGVTVARITNYRVVDCSQVPTSLMIPAGFQFDFNEAEPRFLIYTHGLIQNRSFQRAYATQGRILFTAFASRKRLIYYDFLDDVTPDNRDVALFDSPFSKLRGKSGGGSLFQCKNHHTRGRPVDAMNVIDEFTQLRMEKMKTIQRFPVQRIRVDKNIGRFVDDADFVVCIENRHLDLSMVHQAIAFPAPVLLSTGKFNIAIQRATNQVVRQNTTTPQLD